MRLDRERSCHHIRTYECEAGTKSLRLSFFRGAFGEPSTTLNIALGNVPCKFEETYATADEVDELAKALRNTARQMRRARREWEKKGSNSAFPSLPILGDKP